MRKKTKPSEDPFDKYDFDFKLLVAYRYPDNWSEKEKKKFRALRAEEKSNISRYGGGVYIYGKDKLRIMSIQEDTMEKPNSPPTMPPPHGG